MAMLNNQRVIYDGAVENRTGPYIELVHGGITL